MYTVIRSVRNVSKSPIQCACYSTASKPNPEYPKTTPPKEKPPHSLTTTAVKSKETEKVVKKYDPNQVTKEDMVWRTPWHQKESESYSMLRAFATNKNQTELMKWIQSPIDLSISGIKRWWAERQEFKEMMLQSYLPERHQTLGNELAAAHFVVHRGGAVKFYHQKHWIKMDEFKRYKLPRFYQEDMILQAIDCTDMNLFYEGLTNLRGLKQVEWLSFNGVERLDDWYLDKISNMFCHSLVYLDIRNCPKFSERGLGALYKMERLKTLCIDDMLMTSSFELTCLLLQDINPQLDIKIGGYE